MPKLTQLQELDLAIKFAAQEADPKVTSFQVAEEFYESQRELIDPFTPQWVVEKLSDLIRKYRWKARRENDRQLVLEELLGFKHLPRKIEVAPGEIVLRSDATIEVFRKLATQLRKRKGPLLEEVEGVIALMERYTKRGGRTITWAEVREKEAEKKAKKEGIMLPLFPEED
jgi:hypothetical protein